jgi:hypothetical protein
MMKSAQLILAGHPRAAGGRPRRARPSWLDTIASWRTSARQPSQRLRVLAPRLVAIMSGESYPLSLSINASSSSPESDSSVHDRLIVSSDGSPAESGSDRGGKGKDGRGLAGMGSFSNNPTSPIVNGKGQTPLGDHHSAIDITFLRQVLSLLRLASRADADAAPPIYGGGMALQLRPWLLLLIVATVQLYNVCGFFSVLVPSMFYAALTSEGPPANGTCLESNCVQTPCAPPKLAPPPPQRTPSVGR